MKKLFFVLALLFAFAACRPVYHVATQTTTTSDTISTSTQAQPRQIDTLFYTKPDSAALTALIKCDSLNNVYIKELNNTPGKRTIIKYIQTRDTLRIFAQVDSLAIHLKFQARDSLKTVKIKETTQQTKTYTKQEKPTPNWVYFALFLSFFLFAGMFYRK